MKFCATVADLVVVNFATRGFDSQREVMVCGKNESSADGRSFGARHVAGEGAFAHVVGSGRADSESFGGKAAVIGYSPRAFSTRLFPVGTVAADASNDLVVVVYWVGVGDSDGLASRRMPVPMFSAACA